MPQSYASLALWALVAAAIVAITSGAGLPSVQTLTAAPGFLYLGGPIVAFYVATVTLLIPRFGVGNTILFAVSAQIVMAAAMDQFGLLGTPLRPLTLLRITGVMLLLVGLAITQLSGRSGT